MKYLFLICFVGCVNTSKVAVKPILQNCEIISVNDDSLVKTVSIECKNPIKFIVKKDECHTIIVDGNAESICK